MTIISDVKNENVKIARVRSRLETMISTPTSFPGLGSRLSERNQTNSSGYQIRHVAMQVCV